MRQYSRKENIMFAIKSNIEIGSNLKKLILNKYKSVRQFCLAYLNLSRPAVSDDPQEIRNLTNRFSQILSGNKTIQTYDLPIISELLGVSCEDILSCGECKVPLKNRKTNYNIAFSTDKKDWQEYLSHEDHIAAYADEFGKTVVDYAIEFKNYKFIKYLIENDYITFISEDPRYYQYPNFGAESKIAEKPFSHPTLDNEFYENKLLRTQVLTLAIKNDDTTILQTLKARELPPQHSLVPGNPVFQISEYYDEGYLDAIVQSKKSVFDFFLEEYPVKGLYQKNEMVWIYPFIGELVTRCVKINKLDRASKTLDVILNHNKKVYHDLHEGILHAAKLAKNLFMSRSYRSSLESITKNYNVSEDKNLVSFDPYYIRDAKQLIFNIIHVDCTCHDETISKKIKESNLIYDKILTLPNDLIKEH